MAQKPKFGPKKYLTDEDLMEILRSDSEDEHFMENLEDECDHSETSSENSETDQEAGEDLQEQEGNEEDEQMVQDEEIAEQALQAAREPKGKRKTATQVGRTNRKKKDKNNALAWSDGDDIVPYDVLFVQNKRSEVKLGTCVQIAMQPCASYRVSNGIIE
jgi:hypothetical protein